MHLHIGIEALAECVRHHEERHRYLERGRAAGSKNLIIARQFIPKNRPRLAGQCLDSDVMEGFFSYLIEEGFRI